MPRFLTRDVIAIYEERHFKATTPLVTPAMGKRLKSAREMMELSQKQMADLFRVTQTDISRLENGRLDRIPLSTWEFRTALDKHFEYVLTGVGNWKYEEIKWKKDKKLRAYVGSL